MKKVGRAMWYALVVSLILLNLGALILFVLTILGVANYPIDSGDMIYLGTLGVGLWAVMSYLHTKKLDYVSVERKKWREELREALINLRTYKIAGIQSSNSATKDGIKQAEIVRVRILSYLNPSAEEATLDFIVREQFDSKIQNTSDLDRLILCLEFLLKADWEMAKEATKFVDHSKQVKDKYFDELRNELINIRCPQKND